MQPLKDNLKSNDFASCAPFVLGNTWEGYSVQSADLLSSGNIFCKVTRLKYRLEHSTIHCRSLLPSSGHTCSQEPFRIHQAGRGHTLYGTLCSYI
jgi:hypothetical protein